LVHILSAEPHLFETAVENQLSRLAAEAEAMEEAPAAEDESEQAENNTLVLYERINQVKRQQRQQAVQDLMYASILHKFVALQVDLLPPLDGRVDPGPVNLNALTKGVHTDEALEMVRSHLSSVLGGNENAAFSNATIRLSKLQAAQVYAASILFGYFLRRVDKRFRLERSLGTLPKTPEENLAALEELFARSADEDEAQQQQQQQQATSDDMDLDAPMPGDDVALAQRAQSPTLRGYVESFDAAALADTARIVSVEGLLLAERQTGALFGSIESLQTEMQEAIETAGGPEISSPQELMERVQDAVANERVKTLTINMATQTRIVLEGCAYGSFLRDVEEDVDVTSPKLLRQAPPRPGPPPPAPGATADP